MKLIIAYIQPQKLNAVKRALYEKEIFNISVMQAQGCGRQKGQIETYRGNDMEVNLLMKVRIEIAVNNDFKQVAIDAITAAARSGNIGDGKIFVVPLEECVRIRTGETGTMAVGGDKITP